MRFGIPTVMVSGCSLVLSYTTYRLATRERQVKQGDIRIGSVACGGWSSWDGCQRSSSDRKQVDVRENSLASVFNCAWISTPTVSSHSCRDASSSSLRCFLCDRRDLACCLSCLRRGTRSGACAAGVGVVEKSALRDGRAVRRGRLRARSVPRRSHGRSMKDRV